MLLTFLAMNIIIFLVLFPACVEQHNLIFLSFWYHSKANHNRLKPALSILQTLPHPLQLFKAELLTTKYKVFILQSFNFFPPGLNKAKLGWLWCGGNIREISADIHSSNYSHKRSYNKLVLTTKIVFSFCLFRRKFNNRIFYHRGISNFYQ